MFTRNYVTVHAPTDTTPDRPRAVGLPKRTVARLGVAGVPVTGTSVRHIAIALPVPPIVIVQVNFIPIGSLAVDALRTPDAVGTIQHTRHRLCGAAPITLACAHMRLIVIG